MEKAHKRWTPLTIMASRTSCPPAQCSLTLTSVVSRWRAPVAGLSVNKLWPSTHLSCTSTRFRNDATTYYDCSMTKICYGHFTSTTPMRLNCWIESRHRRKQNWRSDSNVSDSRRQLSQSRRRRRCGLAATELTVNLLKKHKSHKQLFCRRVHRKAMNVMFYRTVRLFAWKIELREQMLTILQGWGINQKWLVFVAI